MMTQPSTSAYIPTINEVAIDNFKGIRHCEIKDLARVNLFIGKNSCGKSTIMEAIYFAGKEFIGPYLPQCITRRVNRGNYSARELWYGYNISSDVKIAMKFVEDDLTGLRVQYYEQDKSLGAFLISESPNFQKDERNVRGYNLAGFSHVRGGNPTIFPPRHSKEIRTYFERSVLIDPTIKTDVRQVEGNYLNVLKLSEENSSDLAKRTAEIYDTKPSWEFLPHPDFSPDTPSRFAILEGNRRMFFDNFGDGLHYGLAILAIAKTRTNTGLFIEEIESHQHPEAIKNLVANLLSIAKTNNLQLFITTHNDLVRNYLYYGYSKKEERDGDFRCFHIIRNKDNGQVEANKEEGIANITEDLHGRPE